jgi:hypothetical protein
MQIYIVTAFGVGVSTEAQSFLTKGEAYKWIQTYRKCLKIVEAELVCTDCWKGYSVAAQCDVEIEVHGAEVVIPKNRIEDAKQVLADNGIEHDETETVLQAIGYTLLDTELFPEK